MSFVPSHRIIESGTPGKLAFVLHGALGSGQNFNRFIQRLARERPEYRYVLVDLRHHGDSSGAPPPNTLAACAGDLIALGRQLGTAAAVVIGHSFGGKVGIEYARLAGAGASGALAEAAALEQVWVLDAVPGVRRADETSEIERVIRAVRAVPVPAGSRREVVEHLMQREGLSSGLSEWMATNLRRRGEAYEWAFDLDGIEELIADYSNVDLWDFLAQARQRPEFRMVVAERSDRWPPELRQRARELPASARVVYHELTRSGHWVHVDNPDGLLALLVAHLAR